MPDVETNCWLNNGCALNFVFRIFVQLKFTIVGTIESNGWMLIWEDSLGLIESGVNVKRESKSPHSVDLTPDELCFFIGFDTLCRSNESDGDDGDFFTCSFGICAIRRGTFGIHSETNGSIIAESSCNLLVTFALSFF